jgi:hypothetical protein
MPRNIFKARQGSFLPHLPRDSPPPFRLIVTECPQLILALNHTAAAVEGLSWERCTKIFTGTGDMTQAIGTTPCDITINYPEARIQLETDASNNALSGFQFKYTSSDQKVEKETFGECGIPIDILLTGQYGAHELKDTDIHPFSREIKDITIRPDPPAESITLNFTQFRLYDTLMMVVYNDPELEPANLAESRLKLAERNAASPTKDYFFKVYMGRVDSWVSSYKMELGTNYKNFDVHDDMNSPGILTVNYPFVKVAIMRTFGEFSGDEADVWSKTGVGVKFEWTSSSKAASPPLMDADARLVLGKTDLLLTEPSGEIKFEAPKWMEEHTPGLGVGLRGYPIQATRARWTIYPDEGADSITLSFSAFKPSALDQIYIRSCFHHTLTNTLLYLDDTTGEKYVKPYSSFRFMIRGKNQVAPCPITVHEPCVQIDVDFEIRHLPWHAIYQWNIGTDQKVEKTDGFILKYSSSTSESKEKLASAAAAPQTSMIQYGCPLADMTPPRCLHSISNSYSPFWSLFPEFRCTQFLCFSLLVSLPFFLSSSPLLPSARLLLSILQLFS